MKVKSILSLSVKNIFLKKFAYLKVLAGFFFAFLIIFIVLFYSGSLSIAYDDYENMRMDDCYYSIYSDITEEQEREIRAFPQVGSMTFLGGVLFAKDSMVDVTVGVNGYSFDRNDNYISGAFVGKNSDCSFIKNKEIQFVAETGENLIKYGTDLKSDGDIIVSEILLDIINVEEREELLGKEFSLNGVEWTGEWLEGGEQETQPFEISGRICGILNGLYDGADFYGYIGEDRNISVVHISLKAFTGNEDLFAKADEMFGEEVMHTFVGSGILDDMKTVEGQEMLCNRFLSLICVTLLAVICVYVASNQYYLLLKNSVFYGILKANGVSNREVFLMHMFELAIILVVSLVLAFGASVGLFFIMQTLFDDFVGINLIFPAGVAVGAFFGFAGLCAALAVLITLFIYVKILKKPPVGLLKK